MDLSAQTAAARVDALIALTEELTRVIETEARAIERQDHAAISALRQENVRLTQAYREQSGQLRAEPQLFQTAPAERRQRLVRASQAFDEVLLRQRRAILAAKTVTEGLIQAIAAQVVAQRSQGAGYGPTALPPAGAASLATAVALNRRA